MKKSLLIVTIAIIIASCTNTVNPTITMDPIKDAETCLKLYKKNPDKGLEYMQSAMFKYNYNENVDDQIKFSSIVAEGIAEIDMKKLDY